MPPQTFDFPAIWKDIRSDLLKGESVLLSAPRHWGKNSFYKRLINDNAILKKFATALIDPDASLNYASAEKKIWKDVASQCRAGGIQLSDKFMLDETWLDIKSPKKILLVIKSSAGNKQTAIQLLNALQLIAHEHPASFPKQFSLLVLDDGSLSFYEMASRFAHSFFDVFDNKKKILQYKDPIPLYNILQTIPSLKTTAQNQANLILRLTGGHLGLIYLLLAAIIRDASDSILQIDEAYCRQILLSSPIIESVKKVLMHGGATMLQEIQKYKTVRMTDHKISETEQTLHIYGILVRVNSVDSICCPGIIEELVRQLQTQTQTPPPKKIRASKQKRIHPPTPNLKEVFFSYAHGKGATLMQRIYDTLLATPGIRPIMDKKDLPYRELITTFMLRIGQGNFVVVAIGDRYLRSTYCMYELFELYRHSNLDINILVKKILPIRIEKISLQLPATKSKYFDHWAAIKKDWDEMIEKHGKHIDASTQKEYDQIKNICDHLGSLIEALSTMNASNIKTLSNQNFDAIITAIGKN